MKGRGRPVVRFKSFAKVTPVGRSVPMAMARRHVVKRGQRQTYRSYGNRLARARAKSGVEATSHFPSGPERSVGRLWNANQASGSWISARSSGPHFHGERTKAPQLDPVPAGKSCFNLLQNGIDDLFHVAPVQV
jgi:hypothetical protein